MSQLSFIPTEHTHSESSDILNQNRPLSLFPESSRLGARAAESQVGVRPESSHLSCSAPCCRTGELLLLSGVSGVSGVSVTLSCSAPCCRTGELLLLSGVSGVSGVSVTLSCSAPCCRTGELLLLSGVSGVSGVSVTLSCSAPCCRTVPPAAGQVSCCSSQVSQVSQNRPQQRPDAGQLLVDTKFSFPVLFPYAPSALSLETLLIPASLGLDFLSRV
ncbi:hypothetical protein F7725_014848 [Dissostichus mawsoni]|uniref:Uncharacterized protein n=1 Tax=Dissostichus mawsoni TaxID=36200 RepID=A0A7J5YHD0_DISMA|nr:hypothetical protein F7725_014848 [Dissostichus mawsoni]